MYIVGEIRAFAFDTNSERWKDLMVHGWMECNGDKLPRKDYPELFRAIGNGWSGDDEVFRLPDLRGMFLRGWDHGRKLDKGGRQPVGGGGNTGDMVGTHQDYNVHGHTHKVAVAAGSVAGSGAVVCRGTGDHADGSVETTGGPTASGEGAETRPVNVTVMYGIYTGVTPRCTCKVPGSSP